MFLCRMALFSLHESPRFLVAAGRPDEAVVSLQKISNFNGGTFAIELQDVCDQPPGEECITPQPTDHNRFASADDQQEPRSNNNNGTPQSYDSTGALEQAMDAHTFDNTPSSVDAERATYFPPQLEEADVPITPARPRRSASAVTTASTRRRTPRWLRPFPRAIRRPTLATLDKLGATLSPEWRGTTLLVWVIWFLMSLGQLQLYPLSIVLPN